MDLFIDNKYLKIYLRLADRARSRSPIINGEKHHFIPKSIGGSNKSDNLILLTSREHFICHLLLTKITQGEARKKMIYAARYMSVTNDSIKVSSRLYQRLKEEHRKIVSEALTGRSFSPESKHKMSLSQKANTARSAQFTKGHIKTKEHCDNISNGKKGKATNWGTPENRQAVSTALTGRSFSDEHKQNISKALKGKSLPEAFVNLGGYKLSEETKKKMSKPKSEETKQRMREAWAKRKADQLTQAISS